MTSSRTPMLDAVAVTTDGTWVRHALVDVAGDLVAGVLLSQIAYWFGVDRKGRSRLTIEREGRRWLAKSYNAWWEECRVTEDQARRAVRKLADGGIVETRVWKFQGAPTVHIHLVRNRLEELLSRLVIRDDAGTGIGDDPGSIRATAQIPVPGVGPDGSGPTPTSIEQRPRAENTSSSASSCTTVVGEQLVDDDDDVFENALEIIGDAALAARVGAAWRAGPVAQHRRWRAAVIRERRLQHRVTAASYLAKHPGASARALARHLEPELLAGDSDGPKVRYM